jgi:hypothetical protein
MTGFRRLMKSFKGHFIKACAAMTFDTQIKGTMRLRLPGDMSSRLRLGRAMSGGGVTPVLQRCEDTPQRRSCRTRWRV